MFSLRKWVAYDKKGKVVIWKGFFFLWVIPLFIKREYQR
jgi:hypothetical protein